MAMIMFIIGAVLTMTACMGNDRQAPNQAKGNYPPELAVKNGDVVNLHGKVSNLERFNLFVSHFENGRSDHIRITMYTIEGDPIFYNLNYDGKDIQYTFDSSKDAFGGTGRRKQSTTCANLEKKTDVQGIRYTLAGCSGNHPEAGETFLFTVPESDEMTAQ
jgi:hypothetical protein